MGIPSGAATTANSAEASQNIKIELPYDAVIPLLDICPKKMKSLPRKDAYTPIITIYCNIIYNSQDRETT